ncbi:hypothetical protein JOQ06_002112, partial [Pogonophryne albipinna]
DEIHVLRRDLPAHRMAKRCGPLPSVECEGWLWDVPPSPPPPQPHPKRPVQQSKVGLSTKSWTVQAGPPSVIDSASRSNPLAQ